MLLMTPDVYKNFVTYCGDNLEIFPKLLENSVTAIFADPPYFLSQGNRTVNINGRHVNFDKGEWDRTRPVDQVHDFNIKWLTACRKVLKKNGTIWVCGTYHNIFDIATCLQELSFKILNVVVWHKSDPPETFSQERLNFSAEYIIWARYEEKTKHFFNYDLMKSINGGKQMPDVWQLPSVGAWEKRCGKHPTQKPLRLLYRIILACTKEGDTILDPFAGSCTTGIAANLLGRKFIGIDQSEEFLQLGVRRRAEIDDPIIAQKMIKKMQENPMEVSVLVNHAKPETKALMIEKGICYMRAGDSKGSLQITPGFERMRYVLLHSGGNDAQLFHIKQGKEGTFEIWSKENLEKHGFNPEHAAYYIVIRFEPKTEKILKEQNLKQKINTYRAKIRPLSDFIGIK